MHLAAFDAEDGALPRRVVDPQQIARFELAKFDQLVRHLQQRLREPQRFERFQIAPDAAHERLRQLIRLHPAQHHEARNRIGPGAASTALLVR